MKTWENQRVTAAEFGDGSGVQRSTNLAATHRVTGLDSGVPSDHDPNAHDDEDRRVNESAFANAAFSEPRPDIHAT